MPSGVDLFSFQIDLGQLHHLGVVVDDIDAAAQHFEDVYGIGVGLFAESSYRCRVDGVEDTSVQRLGLSIGGPPHIELLRTVPGSSVWRPSSGIHHLGFVVEDLSSASEELERRGAPLWVAGGRGSGSPEGTAYHRDAFGLTIELLDRATQERLANRLDNTPAS